jgi:hypothetical protein
MFHRFGSRRRVLSAVTTLCAVVALAFGVSASAGTTDVRTSGEAIQNSFGVFGKSWNFNFTFMARSEQAGDARGSFTWYENGDSTVVNTWPVDETFFPSLATDPADPKKGGIAQFVVRYQPGTELADYVERLNLLGYALFGAGCPTGGRYEYVPGSPVLIEVRDRWPLASSPEQLRIGAKICAGFSGFQGWVTHTNQFITTSGDLSVKPAPWPKGTDGTSLAEVATD